jgi:hypothetical protein
MIAKMNVVGGATMSGGKLQPYVADKGEPGPASTIPGPVGIAAITFGTMFDSAAVAPSIGFWAIPSTAVGGVKATQVAGTLSKAGVQIKVEAPNILTAVLGLLVGATVFVIAIEQ